jgi:hypothetical protein
MKSNWALGCTTRDRRCDGRDALRHNRDCNIRQAALSMTFGIETAAQERFTVFILSGRLETQAIAELRRLFELQTDRDIVLDLKDVGVIDREVTRFLVRCEADGVKLENCPSYIREWMEREKG